MPKLRVNLTVEFDADISDPDLQVSLDKVLSLQPSCKLVSKKLTEINGIALSEDLTATPLVNGNSDSYRPDYSNQDGEHHRPSFPSDHVSSSRLTLDSYRPMHHLLYASGLPSADRKDTGSSPYTIDRQPNTGEKPLSTHHQESVPTSAILGTRYDALIADMIAPPRISPSSTYNKGRKNRIRQGAHYSPPPSRRDRSASPSHPRRSDRLRASSFRDYGRTRPQSRSRSQDSLEELHRELAKIPPPQPRHVETTAEELEMVGRGTHPTRPGSLKMLAAGTVAKDLVGLKDRTKFQRQQERMCWTIHPRNELPLDSIPCITPTNISLCFEIAGHGVTEALRLKNLRSNNKIEKTKRILDRQRWGEGEVREGARMDAVIDRTYLSSISTPSDQLSTLQTNDVMGFVYCRNRIL